MGAADENKRRRPHEATAERPPKRKKAPDAPPRDASKPAGPAPTTLALSASHEATLAELRPKYDVLVASIISSTKITARVQRVLEHLQKHTGGPAPVVLLHARPADVCKMITVAERAKGALAEGGAAYQYNQLFELPARPPVERDVVEETVLPGAEGAGEEGEESDDGFEKLEIFDRAANPREERRPVRSMGIFLAGGAVPELKGKGGVTAQTAGKLPDGG